jgi:hypothetical protein
MGQCGCGRWEGRAEWTDGVAHRTAADRDLTIVGQPQATHGRQGVEYPSPACLAINPSSKWVVTPSLE